MNWSARQPLVLDGGEQMYPTIIGTGPDPQMSGQSFYVYYTDGSRWGNAQLARRLVTFDPSIPPVLPPPPGPDPGPGPGPDPGPDPTPTDWVSISDYKDDFQGGGPAPGWTYAWNSNGKTGQLGDFLTASMERIGPGLQHDRRRDETAAQARPTTTTICSSAPIGDTPASRSTCRSPATPFKRKTGLASTA